MAKQEIVFRVSLKGDDVILEREPYAGFPYDRLGDIVPLVQAEVRNLVAAGPDKP